MENGIVKMLGERIRALRKARSWSQEELADACGINQKYLSELERGRINGSIAMYHAIAQGLDMSLSDLTIGLQDENSDDELLALFNRAQKLDQSGRKVVIEALRGVLRGVEQ